MSDGHGDRAWVLLFPAHTESQSCTETTMKRSDVYVAHPETVTIVRGKTTAQKCY